MSDYINDNIKVWVGCLASYNNGQHHGQWIDLEKDASTLKDFYKIVYDDILKNSPADDAEEWEIFDTMGLGERNDFNYISAIYKALEIKKNCDDVNIFNAALNCCDCLDDLQSYIENFVGFYDSKTDFAEEMFNDCEQCPDRLSPYIDIERYARDIFYDYEFCEKTGAVFASF